MAAREAGPVTELATARAVFVGRFQPLHRGHHRVITTVREQADTLVIALGSPAAARTPENPLSAEEREATLGDCYPDLPVVRVADEGRGRAGERAWGRRLCRRTDADVVVSGNERVQRIVRDHTDAAVHEPELHAPDTFSGTAIRRRIRAGEPWRDRVPECCRERVADLASIIARTGED